MSGQTKKIPEGQSHIKLGGAHRRFGRFKEQAPRYPPGPLIPSCDMVTYHLALPEVSILRENLVAIEVLKKLTASERNAAVTVGQSPNKVTYPVQVQHPTIIASAVAFVPKLVVGAYRWQIVVESTPMSDSRAVHTVDAQLSNGSGHCERLLRALNFHFFLPAS